METRQESFERILSGEAFKGLKAILGSLSSDREALSEKVLGADSFEALLSRLGYRLTLIPQIHVQDAYSRLSPAGGIKTVLPYHDIPTQRALPTLVNFDATVTTTPEAADFFGKLLASLKTQLAGPGQATG
jgi:hypothetical protein